MGVGVGAAVPVGKDGFWVGATDSQLEDALHALERALMSRVYLAAMFPHAEGDYMRDTYALCLLLSRS